MAELRTATRRISGPRAQFRGKVKDRVIPIKLTPEGHAALERCLSKHPTWSRQDLIELLVRKYAATSDVSAP